MITITAPGIDKGSALMALCRHMGIDPREAAAIGDSEVDIPMFEAAGRSVAMADGTEEAKAAATELTASADEDGVAVFLESLL
jgi:hydroxymethylpyrimidine pyrophosphatase-like HAD family hydrolase